MRMNTWTDDDGSKAVQLYRMYSTRVLARG